MTPQLLDAEMAEREEAALIEVDRQAREKFGADDRTWMAEDWDWLKARRDRVRDAFHSEVGERRADA